MKDNCSLYNLCSFLSLGQDLLLKEFANDVRTHGIQKGLMAFGKVLLSGHWPASAVTVGEFPD